MAILPFVGSTAVGLAFLSDGCIFPQIDSEVCRSALDPSSILKATAHTAQVDDAINWRHAQKVINQAVGMARQVRQQELLVAQSDSPWQSLTEH